MLIFELKLQVVWTGLDTDTFEDSEERDEGGFLTEVEYFSHFQVFNLLVASFLVHISTLQFIHLF